jgi:hypothetical protein
MSAPAFHTFVLSKVRRPANLINATNVGIPHISTWARARSG